MPWSPIPKMPEIVKHLKREYPSGNFQAYDVATSVMAVTGLMREKTIRGVIEAMVRLRYLHMTEIGVFRSGPAPKKLLTTINDADADVEADAFLKELTGK